MKKLSLVHFTSEVDPFTKTGGLGDVARALPKALEHLGHDVAVVTPYYGSLDYGVHGLTVALPELSVPLPDGTSLTATVYRGQLTPNLPVYLIAEPTFFGKRRGIYGDPEDNRRFYVFSLAALEAAAQLGLTPDIVHCHDWQTGLVPDLLQTNYRERFLSTRSVFTIHNLAFQFGHNWWEVPAELRDTGRTVLPPWHDQAAWERVNFAKRAIQRADYLTTVSEQYAEEILTKNFGQDLQHTLVSRRGRLVGIVNGLDYRDYNPATDPGLHTHYDLTSLDRKYENKRFLQRSFSLPERAHVPVVGMVSRLSEQKGFDLLLEIIEPLLRQDLQLVVMGGGDQNYVNAIRKAAKRHRAKFAANLEFDAAHATQVYAGSDMFLMPSRFEPCGLGQLISLRYGSIPIVHATGGLIDTIKDYNPGTGRGNGFVFHTYDSRDLLVALTRAVVNFRHPQEWRKLVERGMQQSFSWYTPAQLYVALYRHILRQPTNETTEASI